MGNFLEWVSHNPSNLGLCRGRSSLVLSGVVSVSKIFPFGECLYPAFLGL